MNRHTFLKAGLALILVTGAAPILAQEFPMAGKPIRVVVPYPAGGQADTLGRATVLVPASPAVKRLQAIVYTQLQRAMLGQISSDAALAEAERQWNAYAEGRWPSAPREAGRKP